MYGDDMIINKDEYEDCLLPLECNDKIIINQRYYKYDIDEKVYKTEYEMQTYPNFYEVFSDMINYNLYYSFNIKNKHSHTHSFDSVIRELYYNPETFNIDDKDKILYSKQELIYLRKLQKFLLALSVKDIKNYDKQELVKRSKNRNVKKILEYRPLKCTITAQLILNGKRKYMITKYYNDDSLKMKGKYIILDSEDNYLGLVETIKQKIKIKEMKNKNIDFRILKYKNIDEYKKDIMNDFNIKSEEEYVVLEKFIKINKIEMER